MECGFLVVPEDRAAPQGRSVRLAVARFKATLSNPAADPIIYLEGGPGGSPLRSYVKNFTTYFGPFAQKRDVILYDQRGTGYSDPALDCTETTQLAIDQLNQELSPQQQDSQSGQALQTCHDRLKAKGINLGAYTPAGTLTVKDFPAPTCATCHFSGFGGAATTHKVGERLTWYLFSSVSERRPAWQDNLVRMQTVCLQCHNKTFLDDFYAGADNATLKVNSWVTESDQILQPLKDQKLLSDQPFVDSVQFDQYELWHHYGRTAKFGTWMQGPDYTQWHGAYEVIKSLAELRQTVSDRLKAAGK